MVSIRTSLRVFRSDGRATASRQAPDYCHLLPGRQETQNFLGEVFLRLVDLDPGGGVRGLDGLPLRLGRQAAAADVLLLESGHLSQVDRVPKLECGLEVPEDGGRKDWPGGRRSVRLDLAHRDLQPAESVSISDTQWAHWAAHAGGGRHEQHGTSAYARRAAAKRYTPMGWPQKVPPCSGLANMHK